MALTYGVLDHGGTAHHVIVDHYRSRKAAVSLESLEETLAGSEPRALDELMRSEKIQRVRDLLARLPPDTRRMFELRFDQDLRYREIAGLLGSSEAAIKQRFSRIMKRLAEEWSREGLRTEEEKNEI